MKKKIFSCLFALICVFTCGLAFTGCGKKEPWTPPRRVTLALPDKLHVEYVNPSIKGDSTLPGYCVLVKEGDYYYVKTPTKNYSSNRLEVYIKVNLKTPVEFEGPEYGQAYISACYNDSAWLLAKDETQAGGYRYDYWANDQNASVYYTGTGFLDSGYGYINHSYDNGVTDKNGYRHYVEQKANETLTIGGKQIVCEVWEYEFTHNGEVSSRAKYWVEAETKVMLQTSTCYDAESNLNDEENIGLRATYFSTNETMQSYLGSVDRLPAPDFSNYN